MDFNTSQPQSTRSHYRVLLINDNPDEVAAIRRALGRSLQVRFQVTHTEWMSAAVRALQTEPFDITFADLFLPDRSGVGIISELRALAPRLPIVATARIGTERMAAEALHAGADDYFQVEVETAGESNLLVRIASHVMERKQLSNRLSFLHEASNTLAASLDLESTIKAVHGLVIPHMADCCILEFVDASGKAVRSSLCGPGSWFGPISDGEVRPMADFTVETATQLAWSPVVAEVLNRGKVELFADMENGALQAFAYTPAHYAKLQALHIKSIIIAPLTSGGTSLGSLSLAALDGSRSYGDADVQLLEEFARRCAVALDNALLYEKVETALEAQEELLARVSHDLRTPLTSIRAGLGLLTMNVGDKLAANEISLLNNAKRGAERLGLLVNDLLTQNEISRNGHGLDKEPIDLCDIVEDSVTLLGPLVQGKNQQLKTDLPGPLPYVGNAKLLGQAITNLLDNAHMHTPAGTEITVSCRVTPTEMLLVIQDNGPGIAPELHEAIFERFYKAPSARRGRGLGLGLTIARTVVELHGGRLWIESTPGEGTTFFISLPQPEEEEAEVSEISAANREDC
ncbi:MAG TPA: ATP-binding protein [Chloroflexia bacterium]|jgi:signal transduction histidine kinase/DNA-binding NarL/FixJ family response regulator